MKKYSYDLYNWVMYILAIAMFITPTIVSSVFLYSAYEEPTRYLNLFPVIMVFVISLVFQYHLYGMPYSYELLIDQKILRCESFIRSMDIPIELIRKVNMPPDSRRVQIGSLSYDNKRIFINATLVGTDEMIAEMQRINPSIQKTRLWFS